jgi:lipoprotein-anchoring transpeptidase ErfK/SrfK
MNSRNYSRYSPPSPRRSILARKAILLVVAVLIISGGVAYAMHHKKAATLSTQATNNAQQTAGSGGTAAQSTPPPNACSQNTLDQNIIVSITKQHLWACAGSASQYDSAVVTGMEQYPADLTPTGTYHIYAKQTDLTLRGSDSTGSWSDPVSYWMPFLDNQYGTYGFHDATWRVATDFGHVDINAPYTAASHASHGCVELPLAAGKWLYDWASVGTTVTIES